MSSAAQLDRPSLPVATRFTHGDDPHLIAVLFAEQGHRTGLACLVQAHQPRLDTRIQADLTIDAGLDIRQLRRGDRLVVRDIEAQAVRRDK